MKDQSRSRISEWQFGFREGRSTLDALHTVVSLVEHKTIKGEFADLGVSLDVRNAFNSLPWPSIRWALERTGSRPTCVE